MVLMCNTVYDTYQNENRMRIQVLTWHIWLTTVGSLSEISFS